MEEYILRLKQLSSNFSYEAFIDLLKEIDSQIISGNITYLGTEFVRHFDYITNFTRDTYVLENNQLGSLGHFLLETTLLEKREISPTTAICFFLEQKKKLGFENICNEISFDAQGKTIMYIDDSKNNGLLSINCKYFKNLEATTDERNYEMMWAILHELAHVYQYTRTEETDNVFDKLVYYDYQQLKNLQQYGTAYSDDYRAHQAFISEVMADEQADVFMLDLCGKHPEYFTADLIEKKKLVYKNKKYNKNNLGYITEFNPRAQELYYMWDLKDYLAQSIDDFDNQSQAYPQGVYSTILSKNKEILIRADEICEKRKPLIEKLEMQGISERSSDKYYSIFLNTLYSFDGETIVLENDLEKNNQEFNFYK